MADKKISVMPDLAGAQIAATQLTLRLTTGAASAQNVRSSLTDFFANCVSASIFAFNADPRTSGSSSYFRIKTPADTTLTAGTESVGIQLGGSAAGASVTRQFATGAIAIQREIVCVAPTYGFVAASTITDAINLDVASPLAGPNATLTNSYTSRFRPSAATHKGLLIDHVSANSSGAFVLMSTGGTFRLSLLPFDLGGARVGGWIDMSTTGPSGIGNGGVGANAWVAFADTAGAYLTDALTNDIIYRNNAGRLLFGNDGAQSSCLAISSNQIGVNKSTSLSASLDVVGRTTTSIALQVSSQANSTVDLAAFNLNADDTSTVANMLTFDTKSNGAVATGFGCGWTWNLESSTTDSQTAATLRVKWSDATHASRTSAIVFGTVASGVLADKWAVQGGGNFAGASGGALGWSSSSTDPTVAIDTGLARFAAAGIRVTNGSSGAGNLLLGTSAGAIGTGGAGVLAFTLSTTPSNFPTDTIQLYSRDAAAGDAQLLVANEQGEISRLTSRVKYATTNFNKTNDTTLADVTGLSFNVEASVRYSFEATLYTTSGSSGGVKFAIAGTATATTFIDEALVFNAAALAAQTRATIIGTAIGGVTAVTAALCTITGTILVNAAGTLTVQFAQNVSNATTSTVLAGSCFRIWQS